MAAVADGDIVADLERLAVVAVKHAVFLDVGAGADPDGGDISADDGAKPEGTVGADGNIAADDRIGSLKMLVDALHPEAGAKLGHGGSVTGAGRDGPGAKR